VTLTDAAAAWPALTVRGLVKSYGPKLAVADVSLDVPRGSFFGIVGPNGAGKTTTLRMATGLLRPDRGQVWVDGVDVWADPIAAKERIGVLPEDLALFERLRGRELLEFHGLLRNMDPAVIATRSAQLLDLLGLTEAADALVVDYSHGMRKKLVLAAALLHAPRLLFLDEPFEAIDPVSARAIRALLEDFTGANGTIVFSSHVMELVERLCDWVTVMTHGRIVAQGTTDSVRAGRSLNDAFIDLVGGGEDQTGDLAWLGSGARSSSG